ncbi:MAG: hypothetical protein HQK53_19590, partial [Oligoflexia bacterium]|nr:hypothetical protein [Oligoflexia bacterium]
MATKAGLRAMGKIGEGMIRKGAEIGGAVFGESLVVGERVVESAARIGIKAKEEFSILFTEFKELVGNQIGAAPIPGALVDLLERIAQKGIRKAEPSTVVNALRDYSSKIYQVGENTIMLAKQDLTHILERHHPDFWNGTIKNNQSFFNRAITVEQIQGRI